LELNHASRIKSNSSGIGKPAALDILLGSPSGYVKAWPIATDRTAEPASSCVRSASILA
jgi:hypothetical protein